GEHHRGIEKDRIVGAAFRAEYSLCQAGVRPRLRAGKGTGAVARGDGGACRRHRDAARAAVDVTPPERGRPAASGLYPEERAGRPRSDCLKISRIRCGVTGSRVTAPGIPIAASIAPAIAAPTALTPASPAPLSPSELSGLGASSVMMTSSAGISRAVGIA